MAYDVSEEYRTIIYNGDSDYDCRLYLNNLLVPVEQIQYIKISSPIIDTTSNTGSMYHIGTFISQKIEIKFRNLFGLDVTNNPNIYLEIGLKVNDNYEYVPIGYYIIDDLGENYQQTCTISCLDYAIKFKSQLDISQFLNADGYIYACDLFEAICRYYGVEVGAYPTTNNYKKIYQYDNDLSGKDYISFLAELFGGNAKIGRDGKCYIFSLNGSVTKEIEGDNFTIENSIESKATFNIEGKCEQEGIPTPSNPISIKTIGNNFNILNFNNIIQLTTYNLEIINENAIRISGTNIAEYGYARYDITSILKVGKTYTISGTYTDVINAYGLTPCIDVYIGGTRTQSNIRTVTIQNGATYYLKLYLNASNPERLVGDSSITYQNVKIEEGTAATPFSKYGLGSTQIITSNIDDSEAKQHIIPLQKEFCEINGYKDTFVKQNGKWYEKHYVNKIILNGTENWGKPMGYAGSYFIRWDSLDKKGKENEPFLCTHAEYVNNISDYTITKGFSDEGLALWFFDETTMPTTNAWKQWLSQNNVTVYYILETPELIECNEEQIKILESGLQIYNSITHINSESNTQIEYMEKIEPIEINALISKSFEVGDLYEISRICYDDGKLKLQGGINVISVEELPTESIDALSTYYLTKDMKYYNYVNNNWIINSDIKNTLYLRTDNLLITSQEEVDNLYNVLKGFKIYNLKCENRIDLSLDSWDIVKYKTEDNEYLTLYDNTVNFNGTTMGKTEVKIPIATQEETTNIIQSSINSKINRIKTIINEQEGTISTIVTSTQKIQSDLSETNTIVNNNYQDIIEKLGDYAQEDELITVKNSVETIQSSTQYAIEVAESIQTNGVERVTTKTGFTFDEDGLTIEKTGASTKSILDETGLDVRDTTSGAEEDLLFAGVDTVTGEAIVKSKNITVDQYLIVGKYTRFQDYTDANGNKFTRCVLDWRLENGNIHKTMYASGQFYFCKFIYIICSFNRKRYKYRKQYFIC